MDPAGHNQPPPLMMVGGGPYGSGPYQPNSSMTGSGQPAQMAQHQLAYQHIHQQQQHQLQQQLQSFWAGQHQETERATDFKNHSLPLARIKKIMKADEDVRMISAEAPVVFARACEMFVLELTLRAWSHTEENKRRTLQRNDIAAAITRTDIFDFLVDIVPREDLKDEALAAAAAAAATSSSSSVVAPAPRGGGMVGPTETMQYCYPGMPGQHPGMMMGGGGNNKVMMDPGMYAPAQMSYMAQQMWQQPPPPPADQQQSPPDR